MAGRRRFGRVRRLPSGRFQARYAGPDGVDRPAPNTFATKTDADVWLTIKEAEIRKGDWLDPDALIYQHRTTHRDKLIADEISKRAKAELKGSGTQRARGKKKHS